VTTNDGYSSVVDVMVTRRIERCDYELRPSSTAPNDPRVDPIERHTSDMPYAYVPTESTCGDYQQRNGPEESQLMPPRIPSHPIFPCILSLGIRSPLDCRPAGD